MITFFSTRQPDPDALAFYLATGIQDTDILSTGVTGAMAKDALNDLVVSLKDKGIWTKLTAFYPLVGGTASSHKYNLKDPRDLDAAYRLTFYNSPTHASDGVHFNGVDQYADTHINNAVLNDNTWGMGFYSMTNQLSGNYQVCGMSPGGSLTVFYLGISSQFQAYMNNNGGSGANHPIATSFGMFSAMRSSSTQTNNYSRHGSGSLVTTAIAHNANNVNFGRGPGIGYTNKTCGTFYVCATTYLNSTEVADIRTISDTFQSTLSRKPF